MKRAKPESTFAGTGSAYPKRFRSLTIHTPSRSRMTYPPRASSDMSRSGWVRWAGCLVVVYTWRGENIRIISARPAEPYEREEYEAEL
jgi:uncharacterized DUF497 family protein